MIVKNTSKVSIWLSLIISLLLHIVAVYQLRTIGLVLPVNEPEPQSLIKIKILPKTVRKDSVEQNFQSTPNPGSQGHVEKESNEFLQDIIETPSENKLKNISYADLVNLSQGSVLGEHKNIVMQREKYNGNRLGELLAGGSDFAVHFDIPLVFRRELDEGKSTAVVQFISQNTIVLKSLVGDPEIRAAMYESLLHPRSFEKILRLFEGFGLDKIKISVEYVTRYAPYKNAEFETKHNVFSDEILVHITRNLGVPVYGISGIPIDDEHSKRAKKKDRNHLARLRESVAFKRIVKNKKLTRSLH